MSVVNGRIGFFYWHVFTLYAVAIISLWFILTCVMLVSLPCWHTLFLFVINDNEPGPLEQCACLFFYFNRFR